MILISSEGEYTLIFSKITTNEVDLFLYLMIKCAYEDNHVAILAFTK